MLTVSDEYSVSPWDWDHASEDIDGSSRSFQPVSTRVTTSSRTSADHSDEVELEVRRPRNHCDRLGQTADQTVAAQRPAQRFQDHAG